MTTSGKSPVEAEASAMAVALRAAGEDTAPGVAAAGGGALLRCSAAAAAPRCSVTDANMNAAWLLQASSAAVARQPCGCCNAAARLLQPSRTNS
eukprot:354400-Chlamydomonas_euryale.AAC.4